MSYFQLRFCNALSLHPIHAAYAQGIKHTSLALAETGSPGLAPQCSRLQTHMKGNTCGKPTSIFTGVRWFVVSMDLLKVLKHTHVGEAEKSMQVTRSSVASLIHVACSQWVAFPHAYFPLPPFKTILLLLRNFCFFFVRLITKLWLNFLFLFFWALLQKLLQLYCRQTGMSPLSNLHIRSSIAVSGEVLLLGHFLT